MNSRAFYGAGFSMIQCVITRHCKRNEFCNRSQAECIEQAKNEVWLELRGLHDDRG